MLRSPSRGRWRAGRGFSWPAGRDRSPGGGGRMVGGGGGVRRAGGGGGVAGGGGGGGGGAGWGGGGAVAGDEGSAYWVGRRAVRAVMRAYDGRGPATFLLEPLLAVTDLASAE